MIRSFNEWIFNKKDVSGYAKSGTITAIIGATGAGSMNHLMREDINFYHLLCKYISFILNTKKNCIGIPFLFRIGIIVVLVILM